MKNLGIAPVLMTLLLIGLRGAAQTGDWQVIENLPQRTLISVEDMHHVIHETCRFKGVLDGQLYCEYGSHAFGPSRPSEIGFRRESVRAVRREHNRTLLGLSVGAGAGAVIGASRDSYPGIGRGGSALMGAGLLGSLGAIVGSANGHFSHGKLIYQTPDNKNGPTGLEHTTAGEVPDESAPADRIAAARTPYTQRVNYDATLAHTPARPPRAPVPRRQRYPDNSYPGMWTGDGNPRHAAIGAIIGFGLGAALGAKGNTDQHAGATVRASVLLGSFGAVIGAAVGHGNPSFSRRHPRTRWPNEDDIVGTEGTSGPPSRH